MPMRRLDEGLCPFFDEKRNKEGERKRDAGFCLQSKSSTFFQKTAPQPNRIFWLHISIGGQFLDRGLHF